MTDFIIKEITTKNIISELEKIGFDSGYKFAGQNKYLYKNFKIYGLTLAQANILKQTALSFGADCAVHRETITCNTEKTDAIIGGSYSQLKKISEVLQKQPFSLNNLGNIICNQINPKKEKTKLVGILNVTPDSFSDGGTEPIEHLLQLIEDGADIIDIGAESTRPGYTPVNSDEQMSRLKPVLEFIKKENISIPVSIDTRSSVVALYALDYGVQVINDVSGFETDSKMPEIIAKYNAGIVIQDWTDVKNSENFIDEIFLNLRNKIEIAKVKGINQIIADVGIGFGKTKKQNIEILNRIEEFNSLNVPLMAGISRKSFLGVTDNDNCLKDTLTAAISYPLMQKNINYLRVHNIKIHKQLLGLL